MYRSMKLSIILHFFSNSIVLKDDNDERVYEVFGDICIIYTFFSNSIVLKDDARVYEVLETLD